MDVQALYAPIQAQQELNNAWSAEQAQKAMDYQTYMSNTAHQREVEDLKKAGLNPVLSAGGNGASTTSGIAASAGDQNITALYGLLSKSLDANMQAAQAMQNSAKYAASSSEQQSDILETGVPLLDSGLNAVADYIYRWTGIKQQNSLPFLTSAYEKVNDLLNQASASFSASSAKVAARNAMSKEEKELAQALKNISYTVDNYVYYGNNPEWYDSYEPLLQELQPIKSDLAKVRNSIYAAMVEKFGKDTVVSELAKQQGNKKSKN